MTEVVSYKIKILKWAVVGLVIRLAIMPFTMHGQDQFFINYFPMQFVVNGIWDPYGYIASKLPHFTYTYYGPAVFFIMSLVNFIYIKVFHFAEYLEALLIAAPMMFKNFTSIDYINALGNFSKHDLYGILFLTKLPFLALDFLIGWLILRLSGGGQDSLRSYKIWMLNIVVLHSVYAVGAFDLIPAFFITLALFCAFRKHPFLSVISISLAGASKLFPYILLLPACLLLGDSWKNRFYLILASVAAAFFTYLPFYMSSGKAIFGFFALSEAVTYGGYIKWALVAIFLLGYMFICASALADSKKPYPEKKLLFYFLTILFLSFTTAPVRFRYFIIVTPFLAVLFPKHKKMFLFALFTVFVLAFLWLNTGEFQLGLLSPVNKSFFEIASLQEYLSGFINIGMLYRVFARLQIACFFILSFWIWKIKIKREEGAGNLAVK